MIDRIDEIIYLPSLRCNLNCKHCGEDQDIGKEQEVDGDLILERLRESLLVRTKLISVTGGEPFLNKSFPQFLLRTLRETDFRIAITSNGYFFDAIAGMVDEIREQDKARVTIAISIDGTEETHDAIRRFPGSFNMAAKTVRYLHAKGIVCGINSVVQDSNLKELEKMSETFSELFPGVNQAFVPMAPDISENVDYEYTDEYQRAIWQYLKDLFSKKRVLSGGRYGVTRCHAGKQNIAIGPDGKVYACLTGAFYKGKERRNSYFLGDLKTNTLDEIFSSERAEEVRNGAVYQCEGCTNPCEVIREMDIIGMSRSLSVGEAARTFELESGISDPHSLLLGDGLLDFDGWYPVEFEKIDGGGSLSRWCWSGGPQGRISSRVFVRTPPDAKAVKVTFSKITTDLKVKILMNGREVWRDLDGGEPWAMAELPLTVEGPFTVLTFLLDRLYRPSEFSDSADSRPLGVCIQDIKVIR